MVRLRTHVLRPTWHYVSPNDIRWMLNLSCNRLKSAYTSSMKGHGLNITEQMYDTANQHIYDMLSGGKSLTKQQITERMAEKGLPSDTVFMNLFWRMPNARHSFAAALKWETHIPTCS